MTSTRHSITVVGLGPGDAGQLTLETVELLKSDRVFLRTRIHPTVESIPDAARWPSFDDLYEREETFDKVYSRIVDTLFAEAQRGALVYAVPGHPLFGEATVRRLLDLADDNHTVIRVVPAISFLDSMVATLGIDPLDRSLQLVDALELAAVVDGQPYGGGKMPVSPLRPAIVGQIYSPIVASGVKLALLQLYPEDHEITLVIATGAGAQQVITMPLYELDRQPVNHLSSVYLAALDPLRHNRVSEGLQQIVARLRAPGGCPWDREQTHASLTRHMLEEAYEAIHAIEHGSRNDLAEELGDVLLQVYLHAQIAEEAGDFSLEDVTEAISSKLVRRHPHVFGDRVIESSGEVVRAWDQIKQEERAEGETLAAESPFASIPPSLPALSRIQTVLRRARSQDIHLGDGQIVQTEHDVPESTSLESDIASRLVEIVSEADKAGIDAEQALRRWTSKLIRSAGNFRQRSST